MQVQIMVHTGGRILTDNAKALTGVMSAQANLADDLLPKQLV